MNESAVDPSGFNLRTRMTYNANLQRETRTLPAQVASNPTGPAKTSVYWGGNDTLATATCGLPAGTRQNGLLKQITSPAPASGSAVTTEFVYDNLGRTVGTKRGAEGWSCGTFDARSRPVTQTLPAFGDAPNATPARTTTTWYTSTGTAAGDPLVLVQTDSSVSGSIRTVSDLLGRTLTYTDVWGTVTNTTYQALTGRVTQVATTTIGLATKAMQYIYDVDGRITQINDANQPLAILTYTNGELTGESHPAGTGNIGNGSNWTDLTRDGAGALVGASWTFPSAATVREEVVRSQTGRILKNTITRGSATTTSTYGYDAAGRLVQAVIPRHQLTYNYTPTGGCGTSPTAGLNGTPPAPSALRPPTTPSSTPPQEAPAAAGSANTQKLTNTPAPSPPPKWVHDDTSQHSDGSSKSTPSKEESTTTTATPTTQSTPSTSAGNPSTGGSSQTSH